MGNCQAVDAAALVIQHPSGKMERMYWPIMASEVMKTNPGHYVSLIIPLPIAAADENSDDKTVRFSRVKLLRPTDTLVLGRAYRLITTQEVVKVLKAKKYAKMKKTDSQKQSSGCEVEVEEEEAESEERKNNQGMRHEKRRQRGGATNQGGVRSKSWRPSLQSISESGAGS
nr:endoglucanase 12 [Ipomoea batatas]